ncbi:MAG: D-aminoacylase [Alphaproteobacteria bacterium]|nr:MAG: D-aminoacylase [Alphaproteobacteria bacterium]
MTHDIVIKDGLIHDGSGGTPFHADIGIRDGLIAEIGRITPNGARVIDAAGAIVTPGFVDIHTHYDGQACWDPELGPSSRHGVTTVVTGNCGVGFAPLRPGTAQQLIELMEGVEEIPGVALAEGVPFDWESFADYLASLERIPRAIDVATQIAHDPLRLYVMGERGAAGEEANDDEREAMRRLVAEAVRAGAFGVSTGRTDVHKTARGADTPARDASARELEALALGAKDGGGRIQVVSDFRLAEGPEAFDPEFDLVDRMAEVSGCPLSLSLNQRDLAPDQWKRILERVERANARGLEMRVQVGARGIGVFFGLETTLNPLMSLAAYRELMDRPLAERVRTLRDSAFRERLLAQQPEKLSGPGSPVPPLADIIIERLDFFATRFFRLGDPPDYEPPMEASLYMESRRRGVGVMEAILDAMLEDDGRQLIYFPIYNYARFDLEDLRTMLTHPHALPALSDGGAHVGTVCDASFPTFMLTHWGRDRSRGPKMPLEWLVMKQTRDNARFMGLDDRGEISPGRIADINVIDFDRLALKPPRLRHDLPAGGRRLYQEAEGYLATLKSGVPILLDDEPTGETPGRLLRRGRPAN